VRAPEDEDPLAVAARRRLLDELAVRAVDCLRTAGVRAVVLKGPAVATWLYDEPRPYVDVDLLVAPETVDEAVESLSALGFSPTRPGPDVAEREQGWRNEQSLVGTFGSVVDLHHRLVGVPSAARCWRVLSARTVDLDLPDGTVPVLAPAARAAHLALHAAQSGPADRQALEDLRRGLAMLPEPLWEQAVDVARALGAERAFAAGIRLVPVGSLLADRLGLSTELDVELAVRLTGGPQDALFFERLRSPSGRRTWLSGKLRHPVRMAFKLLPALRAWLRARHEVSRTGT
jgi:Uncharacterised nucleotidyltransferase